MIRLNSDDFKNIIYESAALRGKGRFSDAIGLIESKLDDFEPECMINALIELILAAEEAGFQETAVKYAKMVLKYEPELPTALKILKEWGNDNT